MLRADVQNKKKKSVHVKKVNFVYATYCCKNITGCTRMDPNSDRL